MESFCKNKILVGLRNLLKTLLPGKSSAPMLSIVDDGANWSLAEDARYLARIAKELHMECIPYSGLQARQIVFFTDRYRMIHDILGVSKINSRICFPYYHGFPYRGEKVFDEFFDNLVKQQDNIARIQVTNTVMKNILLEAGLPAVKLHQIFIGVDTELLVPGTKKLKADIRDRFNIPQSAVVIGSFQKDGNGWEEGLEPKLIKGPDILVKSLIQLKQDVQELFVFLVGPARGYVKKGLAENNIPFRHVVFSDFREVPPCYHALDAYIVASREEGGPKAVLESMAAGIPVISTKVGQAVELIVHGYNGWLADVEDHAALAHFACQAVSEARNTAVITDNARETALANSYQAQVPLWGSFFKNAAVPFDYADSPDG